MFKEFAYCYIDGKTHSQDLNPGCLTRKSMYSTAFLELCITLGVFMGYVTPLYVNSSSLVSVSNRKRLIAVGFEIFTGW